MKIDFTPQEAQFVAENLAQLSVSINNPQASLIAGLGHSVLTKLRKAIEEAGPADSDEASTEPKS